MIAEITLWEGDAGREVRLWRACECGCDNRGRDVPMVGYITGSNDEGEGFTIELPDEEAYQRVRAVMGGDA